MLNYFNWAKIDLGSLRLFRPKLFFFLLFIISVFEPINLHLIIMMSSYKDRWTDEFIWKVCASLSLCVKVKFCWFLRLIFFDYFLLFLVSCCHPNFVLSFFCVFLFYYSFVLSISLFPSPSLSYLLFFSSLSSLLSPLLSVK